MASNEESLKNVRPLSLANVIQKNPFTDAEADRFAANSMLAGLPDESSASMLLSTKMEIPQIRANLVQRPRLFMQLNQIRQNKLILITAPAGFGKTTLLSAWASVFRADLPIAWVSLDQGDNTPSRFWLYVISAIERALDTDELLPKYFSPVNADSLLTMLINSLNSCKKHFVLILDDLHLIDNPSIFNDLARLLERLPCVMHLILSGRVLPPLPLSRWRANGQSTEIGMEDIRFTKEESEIFLREVMGLKLSSANLTTLSSRTEGWIAGLQMTAISLQGRENISSIIESFTGSDRYILDYLMEEVLQHQPEGIREFLLDSSILPRMTGALCDAVLNRQDGWAVLESLEKANLFIVALDRERQWYRYHHLFSQFLKDRLKKERTAKIADLHRRASIWFEQQDLSQEAIEHALDAQDYPRAIDLIGKISRSMFNRGEEGKLDSWLDQLPRDLLLQNPRLCLAHAYILVLFNHLSEAEPWLENMEEVLSSLEQRGRSATDDGNLDKWDLRVELNLIKTMKFGMEKNLDQTVKLAQETRETLPFTFEVDKMRANWVIEFNLGFVHLECRLLETASQGFNKAFSACQDPKTVFYASIISLEYLARVQVLQGKLRDAAQTCDRVLQLSEGKTNFFSWGSCRANLSLGQIYYEWNELPTAVHYIHQAIAVAESIGNNALIIPALLTLVRVARAQNDTVQASGIEERLRDILRNMDHPDRLHQTYQAQFFVHQGAPEKTISWLENRIFLTEPPMEYPHEMELLTVARAFIALHRWDEAQEVLAQLQQTAMEKSMNKVAIEAAILQTVCTDRIDPSSDNVFAALKRALELAADERFSRVFIDEGEPLNAILHRLQATVQAGVASLSNSAVEYLTRLLRDLDNQSILCIQEPSPLVQILSERETEILKYIASGLSNQEIAKLLFIADGTVKKHLSNIFEKLNVHNRTKAVAFARESGIL